MDYLKSQSNKKVLLLNNGYFRCGIITRIWVGTGVISAVPNDGIERIYEPGEYINLPPLIETLDWGIFR